MGSVLCSRLCSKTLQKQKFSCWPRQLPLAILFTLASRPQIKTPKGCSWSKWSLLLQLIFSSNWLKFEDWTQIQSPTNAQRLQENGDASGLRAATWGDSAPARPAKRAGKASPTRLDWEARNSSAPSAPARNKIYFRSRDLLHLNLIGQDSLLPYQTGEPSQGQNRRQNENKPAHFQIFSRIFLKI